MVNGYMLELRPWDFNVVESIIAMMILECCAMQRKAKMNGIAVVSRIFNCRWRKMIKPLLRDRLTFLRADVHYPALQQDIDNFAEYAGMKIPLEVIPPSVPHPLLDLSDAVVWRARAQHMRNTRQLERGLQSESEPDEGPWTDSEPYSIDDLDMWIPDWDIMRGHSDS